MSEESLSNDRRVQKYLTPPGFEPFPSHLKSICTCNCAFCPLNLKFCNQAYVSNQSENNRDNSKMKNESVKKSLENSNNVLKETRKIVRQKKCIKKDRHVYKNCYELRSRAIKKEQKKLCFD